MSSPTTPTANPLSATLLSDPKQLAARLQSQKAASGAEEFESSLFATVLEKMEKNLSIEDEQNEDAGHDTWGAIGVRAVSQALAQRHVLGVADMIEHSLGLASAAGTSSAQIPQAAAPEKNNSSLPLKIPLKSSANLPMNTPEAMKGAL
jgi:Rod binding domain-containing protein